MPRTGRWSQNLQLIAAVVSLVLVAWGAIPGPRWAKLIIAMLVVGFAFASRFGPAAKAQRYRNAIIELIPTASSVIDHDARSVVEQDVLDPARSALREVSGIRRSVLVVVAPADNGFTAVYAQGLSAPERAGFNLPPSGVIAGIIQGHTSEWLDDDLASNAHAPADAHDLHRRGYRSVAAFPIFDRQRREAALIALHGEQRRFGHLERSFLADLAAVISQVWAVNGQVSP